MKLLKVFDIHHILKAKCIYQKQSPLLHSFSYVQGQIGEKRREYFYYIDHQGQLFLDDARIKNFTSCFKDKEFLVFFFSRLRRNETGRFEQEFPFISPCGRERNFVRCDDVPIVFTDLVPGGDIVSSSPHDTSDSSPPSHTSPPLSPPPSPQLYWGNASDRLSVAFEPHRLCMLPETGRVYHPAEFFPYHPIGLVKSSLAIELAKSFEFEDGEEHPPTHIHWHGQKLELTNELMEQFQTENL